MKRKIIKIDEDKCNGCGLCIPNCAEGALQIIDGKARLISDLFCDGLGACLGHCPEDALNIEEREAEPYDEKKVMETIVKGGENVIKAHLNHMKEHNEMEFYNQALEYLKENKIKVPDLTESSKRHSGCPGSREINFKKQDNDVLHNINLKSQLSQWPIQLHLLNPRANFLNRSDLVIAADCTAYAYGNFHADFLKNKTLSIACPKLDSNQDIYLKKLVEIIDISKINTLTVITMEVPCCGGLVHLAKKALDNAENKIPIKNIIISIDGKILEETWL